MSQEPRYSQDIDTASPTWRAIDRWLKAGVEHGRDALEQPDMSEAMVSWWRGYLGAVRQMQHLPKSDAAITVLGDPDG